jgi:hypothetical protein
LVLAEALAVFMVPLEATVAQAEAEVALKMEEPLHSQGVLLAVMETLVGAQVVLVMILTILDMVVAVLEQQVQVNLLHQQLSLLVVMVFLTL